MNALKSVVMFSASLALAAGCGSKTSADATGESSSASTSSAEASGTGTASSGSSTASSTTDGSTTDGSTTDASTTDASTTGSTSTTGGGFMQVDMLGEAMCDIWSPGDCGDGEKCMPYASSGGTWDALKCVPVADNAKTVGDECFAEEGPAGGIDDCGEGQFCYYVDADTNMGTCIEFCTGSPQAPMCAPQTICTIVNDGVLVLCRPECDPVIQDCEPAGSACYQATGTGSFTCIADKSGNSGAYGDTCDFISSCDAGLACVDAASVPGCAGASCCSNFCDVNAANNCPDAGAGQICEQYWDAPDVGYEHVGVCAIPQPKVDGPKLRARTSRSAE